MRYLRTITLRLYAVILLFLLLAVPLNADDSDTSSYARLDENGSYTGLETVAVDLSKMDTEESMHYAFLCGYQAMLQEKCRGALLTFDENFNYVAGYLTPDAPDDFCTNISPSTLATMEILPSEVVTYMYRLFGDRLSLSTFMAREDKAYIVIAMFEPDENMILTPMWYSDAENLISETAVASGINPDEVYSYLAEDGADKDTIIALVASDKSKALEFVLAAVKLRNEAKKNASVSIFESLGVTNRMLYAAVFILAACVAAVLLVYAVSRLFSHKETKTDGNIENIEEIENQPTHGASPGVCGGLTAPSVCNRPG